VEHKNRTKELTETALFVAVIIVMSAVPFLGYIPLGPINATTLHIPVIIGAILFGWKRGALLGGVFGLTSLVKNTISPNASSFVFSPFVPVLGSEKGSLWALAVVLLPRILIGVFAALVFSALVKAKMARPRRRASGASCWLMTRRRTATCSAAASSVAGTMSFCVKAPLALKM